jgi:hypothetical protein
MHDIVDVIKNLESLTLSDTSFKVLKDFERVIDELDLYVFKNWEDGELISGPHANRYTVSCKFMWPRDNMPDPKAAARLLDYGCQVKYQKDNIMIPRKVYDPSDYRPGTKKGKIDAHPIWIVEITIPKKLMQDIYQGYEDKENQRIADMMRYDQPDALSPETAASEVPDAGAVANEPQQ